MRLGELQAMFAEALVRPQPITSEAGWPARGEKAFTGSARLSPIEQLEVYREQFWIRHVHCLAEDFPTLKAFVGDDARFEAIVADYLASHPPVHFQLRYLGARLADFLARKGEQLLSDIARVEWAYVDAFDAADAPPLDPAAVQAVPEDAWPSVTLVLHPSMQRLRLDHPTHEMRRAAREGQPVVAPARKITTLVIYRRDLLLYTEEIDELAYELLDALARGESLGAASDALASRTRRQAEIEASIGTWFQRWAGLGLISRVALQ